MKDTTITRRSFLKGMAAATAATVIPAPLMAAADSTENQAAAVKMGPKRGVSFYSYSADFGFSKNLEDCFEDVYDMGARGIEILANAHIENYPNPTDEWVDYWWSLVRKYDMTPVEYGHWIDGRVLRDRLLTVDETLEYLYRDMHLAHRLGFKIMRTKMTVKDSDLSPIDNWKEVITRALPTAERLGLVMCPEIHTPSNLDTPFVQEFVKFIKETGTKNFALNIDFSIFRDKDKIHPNPGEKPRSHQPEEIIPLLPYVACCHAKLFHMSDDFKETEIPYERILQILKEHNWNGYLLSEYEGADKYDDGYEVGQTLRKQHIMMKNILGE